MNVQNYSEDNWESYQEADKTTDKHWWDPGCFLNRMLNYIHHFYF